MSTNVSVDAKAKTAKELRKLRGRRMIRRVLFGVGLPTLVAAIYFGLIAAPRYESVTTFTIQSADTPVAASALQTLFSNVSGNATRDVLLSIEYIESRDMLEHLIEEHRFQEHYSQSDGPDFISRLSPDADFEDTYEYYLDRVTIEHDSTSDVLTLRVQAFDAETSQRLGAAILEATEQRVNSLSEAARQDRIAQSEAELERAEQRLAAARQALREAQSEHGDLNPAASAEAILEVRSRIEGELAIARANRSTVAATMPRNSPEAVAARRRVVALEQQIDEQSARLAGTEGIQDELSEFEPIVIEKEFAQRAYESALASLELARVDASRRHRYLVRISGPSEPSQARYPRFWYSILTALLLSIALLGIGTLLIASIREHANV